MHCIISTVVVAFEIKLSISYIYMIQDRAIVTMECE